MKALLRRLPVWLAPSLFLTVFFFLPLARILRLGLDPARLSDPQVWRLAAGVLGFTVGQAALSALLTLLVGLPAAWLFARYEFPGRSLLRALTAVPFMLPTVVVAAAFNALLGPRGWINLSLMQWLDLATPPLRVMNTLGAILLAHVFYNTTIVIRLAGNALAQQDPRLEQAARSLGADPRRAFLHVTLPLLRPALLAALLLVFLFDFTSFGAVLLLGGPRFQTLEVAIYVQALNLLDLPTAALLSLIQLLCTLLFSVVYSRGVTRALPPVHPRAAALNRQRPRGWRQHLFVAVMGIVILALFALPLLALPLRSVSRLEAERGERAAARPGLTLEYYRALFVNRTGSLFYVPPARAARNSLAYAAATVALSLLLGFPVAMALARPGPLEKILDPFLMLPLGASAVTLGLGFLVTFPRWLTWPGLVPLAHTLVALPFVIRALTPTLAAIPDRLRQAAASLGASPARAWFAVEWPIARRAALAAAGFAFTVSLGEFGATALLARPEYPTIPTAIYRFLSQPGGLNYGQAMAMATLLMLLALGGIAWIESLRPPGAGEF